MAVLDTSRDSIHIVGSGIAGLTAAKVLCDARNKGYPISNITIHEAHKTQLGGRAKTIIHDGRKIDIGAHWGHGGYENNFFDYILNQCGFQRNFLVLDNLSNISSVIDGRVTDGDFRRAGMQLLQRQYDIHLALKPGIDISLSKLASQTGREEAILTAKFMARNWVGVKKWKKISAKEFFGDPHGSGGFQVTNGIQEIVDNLATYVRQRGVNILTGSRIESIDENPNTVLMSAANGRIYNAGWCLVTVPVGVLKNEDIQFSSKTAAGLATHLEALSVSHMTKIFVPVEDSFFEKRAIAPNTRCNIVTDNHMLFTHARTAGEAIITIMAGGKLALELEEMSRSQIQTFIGGSLQHVDALKGWENAVDGAPYVTDWSSNVFSRGAYTALKAGRSRSYPPRYGHIIFAGEAFVAEPKASPSTMEGAWYSGRFAARQILARLGELKRPRYKSGYTDSAKGFSGWANRVLN